MYNINERIESLVNDNLISDKSHIVKIISYNPHSFRVILDPNHDNEGVLNIVENEPIPHPNKDKEKELKSSIPSHIKAYAKGYRTFRDYSYNKEVK